VALTAIPPAGAKIRASVFGRLIVEVRPIVARMASDQALAASSTTLVDVDDLVAPVEANRSYDGELIIVAVNAAGTTEDIKIAFSFPTDATFDFFNIGPETAATGTNAQGTWVATPAATSASTARPFGLGTSNSNIIIPFRLTVGSAAGSLQVMAAQNTSGGNVTTVKASSKLRLDQVA
jgi:hypothetical protein